MPKENSDKRRPRVPLSPEELFYFIQLKKIKKQEQLLLFKKSRYYKNLNIVNIVFVFILSYVVLSSFFLCRWQKTYVMSLDSRYEAAVPGKQQRSFSDVNINTVGGNTLSLKTNELYMLPKKFDAIWIGKDYIFGKILKAKLFLNGNTYFNIYTYPLLFICLFVMFIVYVIYHFNIHLTRHGLFGITALLGLAFMYILFV